MNSQRTPRQLLPSRGRIVFLVMVFGIFSVIVPVGVAGDLVRRGSRIDLFHAASLLATAIVSGVLGLSIMRWYDRLEESLRRSSESRNLPPP